MSDSDKISEVLNFRVVIPSWKAPDQAIEKSSSDQTLLLKRKKNATKWLKELMSAYEQNPTDHGATELYEVASLYGEIAQLPKSIANLPHLSKLKIKAHKNSSLWELNPLRDGLDFSLGEEIDVHKQSAIAGIGKFRKLLISNPSRPFCWSELARHYLVVGEKEKAIRCMQTAMHLTKNNRYLSRAATRLFVHVKEHERALELLRSEPSLKNDPWLLSAEIATSAFANKQSTNIKTAQQLLISGRYNNYQLSELAAAVGTVEIEHGATKKAKNLFNTSLITPTANSLAQAQWAVGQDSSIVIPASAWQTPDSYEASTLVARQERNWTKAIMECAKWLADEPFSIRPIYMGSYISFCPNLYSTAEKFANAGLRCDPNNTTLLNNRAVARAYLGRLDEAFIDVKTAQGNNEAKIVNGKIFTFSKNVFLT